MRLLAFVDLHGKKKDLEILKQKSEFVDLVICAGDISVFEHDIKELIHLLSDLNKPIFIIHGNHESENILKKICDNYKNITFLHKQICEFDHFIFVGWGGGGFSRRDKEFEEWISKKKFTKKIVLITHAPPFGTTIDSIKKEHCGNKTFRNFIQENKVVLSISGHIHETAEKSDVVKGCYVINPGPKGQIIEI